MKYVSLHHHSTFSYMDGFGTPEQHIARAAELEMPALALTEHGNVSSHVRHEKAAEKAGVKALFGCELYTASERTRRKWHLTVLAETDEGYRNLNRLVTRAWAEGFYQWPTVSGEMLADHADGLIVLSGCADSLLSCTLLGGKGVDPHPPDYPAAKRIALRFKELLGDRYYLECQQFPELERTRTLNPAWERLSKETGIPLVATSDCHYPYPDDNKMQVILHAAGRGSGSVEAQEASWEYDIRLTPPTSDATILKRLKGTGLTGRAAEAAVAATAEIADRCSVTLPKVERLRFRTPNGMTSKDLIWQWLREGWTYRIKRNPHMRANKRQYVERLNYEMSVVETKDFIDYFLMLSEAVRWAKDSGIPVGPARGSAAASLVCYLLRITEIDPMPFPIMLFERFIDLNRSDIPDVDLDFADDRRDELRLHMIEVYGEDHVGNIGTFTRYRGKNALDDVARVYDIPGWELKQVKSLIVERSGGDSRFDASLEDTVEMFPQAKAVFEKHPDLYNAFRLEGNLRGMSVHAAGLVVSNDPITDTCAMYTRESGGRTLSVLSVDKYDAEYMGLMKADFLGLTTMGMIRIALDLLGMNLEELYDIPLDDPKTIDGFRRGDVVGIFQFGGGTTRIVNGDVKPDTFLELCDINALARPGPLHSGSTQDYIAVKHGRKQPDHLHPIVDEITKWSRFQIIYQEQILQIVREVGGFDWTHAQEIRKIISLKHGEAAFNMREGIFQEGAKRLHGIDKPLAQKIWRRIATAGTYAFNAAHCVSYAMLAYWTMWLKVNHPREFYTACLRKYKDADDQYYLLRDALRHDIHTLPPDRNVSQSSWSLDPETREIRAGLTQISGIADTLAKQMLESRERDGGWASWEDMRPVYSNEREPVLDENGAQKFNKHGKPMVQRVLLSGIRGFGDAKIAALKAAGESEDPFGIYAVDTRLNAVRKALRNGELGPLPAPTHTAEEMPPNEDKDYPVVWLGIPRERVPGDVIEDERAKTGEDFETIKRRMKRPDLVKKMTVVCVDDSDLSVFLRFSRYRFPEFEKALWAMDLKTDVMLVKGKKRAGFGTSVFVEKLWIINTED